MLPMAQRRETGKKRVAAMRYFFRDDRNVLKLTIVMIVQFCGYT